MIYLDPLRQRFLLQQQLPHMPRDRLAIYIYERIHIRMHREREGVKERERGSKRENDRETDYIYSHYLNPFW